MTTTLDRERIASLSRNIPALPEIALKVLDLSHDEDANLHLLSDHARNDPVIAAMLLGLANTPQVNPSGRPVRELYHAISMIGLSRVRQVVVSVSLRGAFGGLLPERAYAAYWNHCIDVASGAQVLAGHMGLPAEQAHFCGLVHDVGKLWLAHNFPDAFAEATARWQENPEISEVRAEIDAFGMDHATVGALLGELWSLPEPIRLALRDHHGGGPDAMSDDPLVVLTHFAEVTTQALQGDRHPLHAVSPLIDSVLRPDWEHLPQLFGEMEALARLNRALVRAPGA